MTTRVWPLAALVATIAMMAVLPGPAWAAPLPAGAPAQGSRTIGTLIASACEVVSVTGTQAWCGTLSRPWDPHDPSLGTFLLAFAVVLPTASAPISTAVVGLEGGPGYGGIDSGQSYAQMLGPLMLDRALVVMDARGTGRSSVIRCRGLNSGGRAYGQAVRRCGESLGDRASLYVSALAADDLAALVEALQVGPVNVYGDSYGTFLAQVFAGRHPDQVRSLVLDGAYPVVGETAWFPTQGHALRESLDVVCRRTRACDRLPGSTVGRLERVLSVVRATSVWVTAPGGDNRRHRVRVTPETLVEVAFGGTYAAAAYREIDASLRAALRGDWLPIGRLVAEFQYPSVRGAPVVEYSGGQSLAVSCLDYPQLYSTAAELTVRRAQFAVAVHRQSVEQPGVYGPFRVQEYLDSDWSEQSSCLTWPADARRPAISPAPPGGAYAPVPTLVISGEIDTITTPAEGALVAGQFANSRQVVMANGLHVSALADVFGCASGLVRAFVVDPAAVIAGAGGRCATSLPPIRGMPAYPSTASGRRIAVALAQTVADVLDRLNQTDGHRGLGLRAGSWTYRGGSVAHIGLHGVRLYSNLAVSGTVRWNWSTGALNARLSGGGREWSGRWNTYRAGARAVLTTVGAGSRVIERFLAP